MDDTQVTVTTEAEEAGATEEAAAAAVAGAAVAASVAAAAGANAEVRAEAAEYAAQEAAAASHEAAAEAHEAAETNRAVLDVVLRLAGDIGELKGMVAAQGQQIADLLAEPEVPAEEAVIEVPPAAETEPERRRRRFL